VVNFKIMVYAYIHVAFIKLFLALIIYFRVIFKSTSMSSIGTFTTVIGLLLSFTVM
jgi:hypothetical protein